MTTGKHQKNVILMDVLIDGFEKNEVLDGRHFRQLPMPNAAEAARKFKAFAEEGRALEGRGTLVRGTVGSSSGEMARSRDSARRRGHGARP